MWHILLGGGNQAGADDMGIGSLQFDNTIGHHVNHGQFWVPNTEYGDFFWELWVYPIRPSTAGYWISAGYGGEHELLFGIETGSATGYLSANFYDASGTGLQDFTNAGEFLPLNEWAHVAMGWDGSHVMQWINGCLSYVKAYSAGRKTTNQASNGGLFIGGSDHSCFDGLIAQVRGYEGSCPNLSDFFPERYFRPLDYASATFTNPQFCTSYMSPSGSFTDTSAGFDAAGGGVVHHHGVLGAVTVATAANIAWMSDNYPVFLQGDIVAPTYAPTPPSTPASAVVFDSFSRKDSTYAFYKDGDSVTGSTEAGSAGVKTWSVQSWPVRGGMLAYWHNYNTINTVDAGISDVDVRVSRINNLYCNTGVVVKYTDTSNYVRVEAAPDSIRIASFVAGVQTNTDFTSLSTNWTTLKVTAVGTTCTVYRDGVSVGSATIAASAATRHGLFGNGSTKQVSRFDDFTIFVG